MSIEKIKILFVGTEHNFVDLLKNDKRFIISQHSNPLSAWNEFSSQKDEDFDAILSQVNTPGLSGLDFFKYIKDQNTGNNPAFILISFQNRDQLKEKALSSGVDDFYEKPFNLDQIYTRIIFLKKYKKRKVTLSNPGKSNVFKVPFLKRLFDIVVSLIGIILSSPILILTAIAIRIESKGRVFYKSKRVGTGYKIFDFYKFRSMRTGADAELKSMESKNQYAAKSEVKENECPDCNQLGKPCSPILYVDGKKICEKQYLKEQKQKTEAAFFKFEDDPRITKVGNFIRKTSIDELPQLFNVLKGDMSLVGNRPLPLYEAELITSDEWSMRFNAPAGITGLWQVRERGKGGEMSAEERKSLDNEYALENNILYDIKILFLTVFSFLQRDNV